MNEASRVHDELAAVWQDLEEDIGRILAVTDRDESTVELVTREGTHYLARMSSRHADAMLVIEEAS